MRIGKSWLKLLPAWPLVAGSLLFSAMAHAQQDDAAAEDEEQIEEIVTTGSRIKRDTFSTTTPIQVLNTEGAQKIGITSITEMLQKSTAVSGQKIDAGFNASAGQTNATESPPDGGVGSSCVNLRGLGCERTLVLINDKRLGLAGIRGAPPQPDINMIPIGMVEGVDLLTGGLSTIYGADAVAGVVNVRLKKDFEGVSLTGTSELTDHEGGEIYQASFVAGVGSGAGNVTFGVEYSRQERVTTNQRDFSRCYRVSDYGYSQTRDGRIIENCASFFPDNWALTASNLFDDGTLTQADGQPVHPVDATRLIFTPGSSNILDAAGNPVMGFSTFSALPQPADPNLEQFPYDNSATGGQARPFALDRFRFSPLTNDQLDRGIADLWRPYERFSLVVNGHLDLDWGHNEELYFEGYYFNRQNEVIGSTEQLAPTVLGQIPLVDSGNNPILDANGAVQLVDNPLNPFPVDVGLIVTMDDVPQTFDTELQQVRIVTGLLGDLGSSGNWSYDISASYDRAAGHVTQPILLENQLYFASQTVGAVAEDDGTGTFVPTGEVVCGQGGFSDVVGVFTLPECVPTDWMNMSIAGDPLNGISGRFATQAEKDYLVANRTNRTVTDIIQLQGYVFGDLFDIPGGGTVGTAFGVEFRDDSIDSQNSAAGVLGLNNAENPGQEGETRGSRTTFDVYGEISAPVVVNAAWADLFQIDAAVRFTDDENFGNETVYKIGALWDINDYLSASTSFNTSFRAPNLREQFLADQAGALPGSTDPCRVATVSLIDPGPTLDRLVNNCILSGADPTVLGNSLTVAIPTTTGGAAGLKPETSDSFTATINASQPWTERFDLSVAVTYFDIEIEDTVRSLDPSTIVLRCFFDADNLASPFCDRVERNRPTAPPNLNFLSSVRAGFVNTGKETASGFDISTRLTAEIGPTEVLWTTGSTILSERLSQEFPPSEDDPDGSPIVDDVGRIGNPKVTFQSTLNVAYGAWDFIWQARWWENTEFFQGAPNPIITDRNGLCKQGCPIGMDPADVFGDDPVTEFQWVNSTIIDDSVGVVRAVTQADGQMLHDLAVSYNFENVTLSAGINNVADEEPPLISWSAGPNRNGAVTSARYDLIGRSYFVRFVAGF